MIIREAYDRWAATYDRDRNLTRDLDARVTRDLLGARHYGTILELGCGTGKNTPLYAAIADRVLALDFSAAMIGQARARRYPAPALFALADLTANWPCAGGSINLAACNLVLEHIADLDGIFAGARHALAPGGHFFICELHPFRQYQGKQATFQREGEQITVPAFVHHISDFLKAAGRTGFALEHLGEWWHEEDAGLPPRLISFLFQKEAA